MEKNCTPTKGHFDYDDVEKKHRVTADIGATQKSRQITLPILDTGAGTNFVSRNNLPSTQVHIKYGPSTIINDTKRGSNENSGHHCTICQIRHIRSQVGLLRLQTTRNSVW